MKILVDEEGRKVVLGLVNAAMGAGAFKSVQDFSTVMAAVGPIPSPSAEDGNAAEEMSCSE